MSDYLTFHYDIGRLGAGRGAPANFRWQRDPVVGDVGNVPVLGAVLFLENWVFQRGPQRGRTASVAIVATINNHVYAFGASAQTHEYSLLLWDRPTILGPPGKPSLTNPGPIGVWSSPVANPEGRRLFVVFGQNTHPGNPASNDYIFRIAALDLDTGAIIQAVDLVDPGEPGRPAFQAHGQDQRGREFGLDQHGALNLVGGRVVATFADALAGDAGTYHGWVVSCNAANLYDQWFFPVTKNVLGGGCWSYGGVAAAADGTIYVGTGNAPTADDSYWNSLPAGTHPGDHEEYFQAVLKLGVEWTGFAGRLRALDWYQPTDAREQNSADLDFASSTPLILPDIAGMKLLVISAKKDIYLLNRQAMGHWGGELWKGATHQTADTPPQDLFFDQESHTTPAYYLTPAGEHYVYFVGGRDNVHPGGPGLIAFRVEVIGPNNARLVRVWDSGSEDIGVLSGPPVVSSITNPSFALVWIVACPYPPDVAFPTGTLRSFNALDGTPGPSAPLGQVHRNAQITVVGTKLFVPTANGFAAFTATVNPNPNLRLVLTFEKTRIPQGRPAFGTLTLIGAAGGSFEILLTAMDSNANVVPVSPDSVTLTSITPTAAFSVSSEGLNPRTKIDVQAHSIDNTLFADAILQIVHS